MSNVAFHWDGQEVSAPAGLTVAAAGFLLGRRVLQRSRALREPRGYFCGIGRCHSCAMTIDGTGRRLACQEHVREGMWVDTLDGDPPPPTVAAPAVTSLPASGCEVLVIGGGPAGRAALRAAVATGAATLAVTAGGDAAGFVRATVWGVFGRGAEWTVTAGAGSVTLRPAATVICSGASEVGPPVRHGTRPGVMTATALWRLLDQGVVLRPFLYGEEPFLGHAVAECRRRGLAPAATADTAQAGVLDVLGSDGVTGVVTGSGTVAADALVFCTPPQPHLELVQAAGADLYWDAAVGGYVPAFDPSLHTSVAGLFVAGAVAGAHTAEQAARQGEIAGLAAARHAAGTPALPADWTPVLGAARAFGVEPLEPRAWAARAGDRRLAPDQWLRDRS